MLLTVLCTFRYRVTDARTADGRVCVFVIFTCLCEANVETDKAVAEATVVFMGNEFALFLSLLLLLLLRVVKWGASGWLRFLPIAITRWAGIGWCYITTTDTAVFAFS